MRLLPLSLILFAAGLLAITGCKQDDEIKTETFTYPDREAIRLRVAIMKRKDLVWFFRLFGPEASVKEQIPTFDAFVRSVRFEEDEKKEPVTWTEPKGWTKDPVPPTQLRYATYRIDAKPKELEVLITTLDTSSFSLLANARRWQQQQLNIRPSENMEELDPFIQRETIAEQPVIWFDATGLGVHTVSKRPTGGGQRPFLHPPVRPGAGKQGPGDKVPFKYTLPEGWKKAELTGRFMAERYLVGEGKNQLQVTLTEAGGSVALNINRWRREVKLPELSENEATNFPTVMRIAGINSYYADIANPQGPPQANRTLAVIIPMGRTNWNIKMWGPLDAVGQNKTAFETFVKSFSLPAN